MRECGRNVELWFLLNRLQPDFRTIADFRKEHRKLLGKIFVIFARACREMKLMDGETLCLDGTTIRASNGRKQSTSVELSRKKLEYARAQLEAVERFLDGMDENDLLDAEAALKPVLVPTGIKAYMPADEVLILANRSSNTYKRNLSLPNGIGVIDSDYYDNPSNEGEIFVQLLNYGVRDLHIKKGERIAQAIFMPYLKSDDDEPVDNQRVAGFGSTGKEGNK